MIELGRHIEILLLSNDCVIVPDLGGFMAHHVDAHYDEDENLFLPPSRTLGFNPLLKLNDSLLAQSYIEAYDISYPEATRRIEEEVNELKQHLCNEGAYELEDIGTLRLNDEGNYIFEPCEAGILTPVLYGLSSFEFKRQTVTGESHVHTHPTVASTMSPTEIKENSADDIKQNAETTLSEPTIAAQYDKPQEEEERTIKIKVAWLRNAAAAAAAIIAFFVIAPSISNSDKEHIMASSLHGQAIINMMQGDVAAKNNTDIEPTKIKEAIAKYDSIALAKQTASVENRKDTTAKEADKNGKYCIVMASHITRRNADAYVKKLRDNGYNEAYTYENNNIVRVVYGKYGNEQEAHSALRAIRGNKYFEQSWVYKKK